MSDIVCPELFYRYTPSPHSGHVAHSVMQLTEVQWGSSKLISYEKLRAAHKGLWEVVEGVWDMDSFNETLREKEATVPWVHEARSSDWTGTLIDMVASEWKTRPGWAWLS